MRRRWRDTVIYEAHVKGLTALHDRVPEHLRGTYAGLAHPAVTDYLRDLGVTAVELLPVHQFVSEPALTRRGTSNYWGYNSIGYFAPHASYSSAGERGGQVAEFKETVKALHRAGLEVILDVVYNHTAEAGPLGPTLSFRGLDDRGFYKRVSPAVDPETGEAAFDDTYWDVTGCGNTVDSSHPLALRLILDSLRYWVTEMHVDGFRFDLMSALTRTGHDIDMGCALLTAIGQDPVLRHVKLIAEPWDASMDGYLVGRMPPPWVEWNDQYRDEIRDFWRNHNQGTHAVATRLAGSSDLYADDGRSAYASINFVTAHDGFTLRDLVTYGHKHNEANGEDNRDGTDNNRSWNHGVEGETDDPALVAVRRRQAANLMATLCLSNGVPMITAGDERGRTQRGNNNAYCQDNDTLVGRLARRRRVARRPRGDPVGAAAAPRAPGAAPAALVRGPAGDPWRPEGPGLAAPVGARDDAGGLDTTRRCARSGCSSPARRCAPRARAASSRWTRRSWSGSTRGGAPGGGPARERLGPARRGGALDRRPPRGGRPGRRRHRPGRGGRSVVVLRSTSG